MLIDSTSTKALYLQIYEQSKQHIMEGIYPAGEKLPPIRKLASELGVARNTVETAYRQLAQEGFISSKSGSGYIVEKLDLADMIHTAKVDESFDIFNGAEKQLLFDSEQTNSTLTYDFTYGDLEGGTFPADTWRKLTTDALFSAEGTDISRYNDNQGDFLLRLNLANNLRASRNVRCFPEQIIIHAGTQISVQGLLQLFDPATDKVAFEEPGYDGVRVVFENCGFQLVPCPVYKGDKSFLNAVKESGAKLVFVTPSNQFPTGSIMPIQTRQHLIEWARDNDAYIIEDDYCREFRYNVRAAPSLQSLDTYHRVIYMGTFSKALSPALRMNYLILPPKLLKLWRTQYENHYSLVPWLSQVVLRRFLEQGHWEKLLRRTQTHNKRKYETLIGSLKTFMGDKIHIMEGGAGLHLLVGVNDGRDQETLIQQAALADVRVYGTNNYWISEDHPLKNYVLIGFSAIPEEKIVPGIEALSKAWF